ncbi:AUGMIN subunit 5-like [Rutidosis leptorrhynchoides]|uniref:AUGMIN subunit 5-like n=1 Tax=Rutidosis leptorrhynchoides TaxID=125765 RepID=UPI003A99AB54
MQSSSTIQPEAIIDWLQNEMNYRPLGPHISSSKPSIPSPDSLRRVCRGNMIPVFNFLLTRVKSEKTVSIIRRNILVHGREDDAGDYSRAKSDRKVRKKSANVRESDNRETVEKERELAEKEVERLRRIVRRKRKELKDRMVEVSHEEGDRKRMLDERSNYRHKQVILEAYDSQCDGAVRILTQYHNRLCSYLNQLKKAQKLEVDFSISTSSINCENGAGFIDTSREKDIRRACESLAMQMIEKIKNSFSAYEGTGIHLNPQLETAKLGIDVDDDVPNEVRDVILSCIKSPTQLLLDVIAYTHSLKYLVAKEIEKIDAIADAETLRYKYENNRATDASPDPGFPLPLKLYANDNNKLNLSSKGTRYQRFERQKAHIQQFVATEDQLNKAAEARSACQRLLKRLYGTSDVDLSFSFGIGRTSQNVGNLRQLELDVWAMEREAAGLKASLTTLTSEVQRLNMLYDERKEAEDSLKKKLKKIEEFDARRLELKSVYDAVLRSITDAATFWSQKPLDAREHASKTIIPACTCLANSANSAKDLIHEEVSAFLCGPDNRLYMFPSTPQALLESVGPYGSTGPESVTIAEKNATRLTARASAGDPSAVPSISRISAALQYPAGIPGSEASLASVLESMEFCLKLCGSEACVLEEISEAINVVRIRRELVESGRTLLNHAYHSQKEHKSDTSYCLDLASKQDEIIMNEWLPELKNGIATAQKSLDDCKYVDVLLDEWWEQPASTVVDWVTVDEQNVGAWQNHVKQLLACYAKELR